MPPLSTPSDTQVAITVAGQQTGLMVALPLLLVRAFVVSLLAGALVEGFERRGTLGLGGAIRGLLGYPLILAYVILSLVGLFLVQLVSILGPALGFLLRLLLPAVVLWALGFVPFSAVRERRPLAETLRRSFAGARTPGGRQLLFCLLYIGAAFVLQLLLPEGSLITANLRPWTWIGVFVLTYVHVSFTAAMAYRWLAIERTIAETPVRQASGGRAPR